MRSCFLMTHIYWFHCQWHYGIFLFLVYICWLYYHCTHHSGLPTRSIDPLESALSIRVVFTFGRPEQLFLDICMCIYIYILYINYVYCTCVLFILPPLLLNWCFSLTFMFYLCCAFIPLPRLGFFKLRLLMWLGQRGHPRIFPMEKPSFSPWKNQFNHHFPCENHH